MISEYDFQREWKRLFDGEQVQKKTVGKARGLVDQLSPESPLRIRFGKELDDIEVLLDRKA